MKIAIIGAGAMGSLFGGLLSDEHEVCLYSHNEAYYQAVSKNGLIMTRGDKKMVKNTRVTKDPTQIGPQDIVIFQVKFTGIRSAIEDAMKSAITQDTLVVSLLNGIGTVDILKEYVKDEQIVYGFSTMTSDMKSPGHVELTTLKKVGTPMHQYVGEPSPMLVELAASMQRVGLQGEVVADIDTQIWRKLLVNCSENTLCSVFKVNVSDLMINNPYSFEIAKQVIFEVSDVARAKGIDLTREAALAHVMKITNSVPYHVPSMVFDVFRERKTEIGCLNQAVINEGKRLGIPTPANEMVVNLICGMEQNYGRTIAHEV